MPDHNMWTRIDNKNAMDKLNPSDTLNFDWTCLLESQ